MKKILTLSELYDFYHNRGVSCVFSADDGGSTEIVVQADGDVDEVNVSDEGLTYVRFKACHTGENKNRFSITEDAMRNASESFKNRPILAYIYTDENGDPQFMGHEMHLNEKCEVEFDEVGVGHIPEDNNVEILKDVATGELYTYVDGILYDNYSKAVDILARDKRVNVSIEMDIRSFTYDAKKELLVVNDYYYTGITLLGRRDGVEIAPAMTDAHVVLLDDTKTTMSSINKKCFEKGGTQKDMLEELMKKYGVTSEDIEFDTENLSDEELETAFEEAFGKDAEVVKDESEKDGEGDVAIADEFADNADESKDDKSESKDEIEEISEEKDKDDEDLVAVAEEVVKSDVADDVAVDAKNVKLQMNGYVEKRELVNNALDEIERSWVWVVDLYDEYVIFKRNNDEMCRVAYKINEDNHVEFIGEPIAVFPQFVTKEELDKLNEDKKELESYRTEEEKLDILNSDVYGMVSDSDEFKQLSNRNTHFAMSVDEVRNRADELLLQYAKTCSAKSANKDVQKKTFVAVKSKGASERRYGGLV